MSDQHIRAVGGGGTLNSATASVPVARLRGPVATIDFDYHRTFRGQAHTAAGPKPYTTDARWHIVVGLRRVRTCIVGPRLDRCLRGR